MTLTHWFLLFGGLIIIAIAIDGVRRMVSRPSTLAIKLDETLQNLAADDYRAELPNGGARIVGQTMDKPVPEPADTATAYTTDSPTGEAFAQDAEMPSVVAENLLPEDAEVSVKVALETIVAIRAIEPVKAATVVEETEVVDQAPAPEFDLAAPEDLPSENTAAEENPLAAVFDPTRPVHEVVESHKMVQSDMFADIVAQDEVADTQEDWQAYTDLVEPAPSSEPVLEVAEQEYTATEPVTAVSREDVEAMAATAADKVIAQPELEAPVGETTAESSSDDILLTDTGLDDEVDTSVESLGARLAKVTSFSFGKMLLENRRQQAAENKAIDEQAQAEGSVVANVEQILTIIVAAKDPQGFFGGHLQGLVEACCMVHGSMDLFHRHEDGLTQGQTQFSMANLTQSGAFDLATMPNVHTAGVVFFMTLPSANDPIRAFDYMVETAQCLANNLGGELYDENRSVLRAQTVEHYRQRIREFERQRLARRAQGGT
ncbi:MAG: cell division protein ZipA [Gammaproteobacteria bacterium]|nr:cell division protein ZipA [Gammaproteobacteria bacterium]